MARRLPRLRRRALDVHARRLKITPPKGALVSVHVQTIKNVFTKDVIFDMKPILDLARGLGTMIRRRVRDKGISGRGGRFSKYPGRKPRKTSSLRSGNERNSPSLYETLDPYWAPAHYPQGADGSQLSHPTRGGGSSPIKSKKHKGARAYPSRKEYQEAIAGSDRKKFKIMGKFWEGLRVRPVRAGYVKLAFFKSSFKDALKKKKVANRSKAVGMNRKETVSILHPTPKEMRWANQYCRLYITSAFLNSQGAQELRIKSLRAAARIEKAIKSFAIKVGVR